jgi:predicted CXXCH cytochrome family protein
LKQFFDEFVYGSKPLPYPALGETKTLHPQITATDSIQILATYDGRGYLENCGCKVNQSGGVARLVSLVRSLRQTFHGPTFAISLGNAFPYDDQTLALDAVQQRETALYIGLLSDVGYDCAVIGESELLYGPQVFRNISATERVSFVSANLRSPQLDDLVAPSKNLESQGAKVLLVGVTAFPFEKIERVWRLRNPNSRFVDIKDAVTNSLRQRDSKELAIAAGAIRPSVGRRLLDMPDGPDVTISYDDNCLCSKQDSTSYHDISGFYKGRLALYAQLGTYGISKFVLYRDATGKIISFSERQIFLDDSVQSDISVRAAIDSFYMTAIKNIPTERNRSLNLWPEEVSAGATYVGAATCRPCHDEQYSQWQRTKHSAAIKTLLHAHRQYNSNCVVCHVTGGGQPSGFRYGDISSDLVNVQCEVCHGPGSRHAASAGTATLVAKPSEALCIQCHDQSHSTMDRQNFQSFYARVAH